MKKVLYILGELEDGDAEWLVRSGRRLQVAPGEPIIREGEPADSLFFVIGGTFRVSTRTAPEVAVLSAGEVVGEISFVDHRPPTATVTALEDARVLAIPRPVLAEKLRTDPPFAARFYRALAVFLAHRLRDAVRHLGDGEPSEDDDELDLDALHAFSRGGTRFERILRRLQEV